MDTTAWLAYFGACWLISLSPGAGAVASMSTGMQYGFRAGLWNIAGLLAGIITLMTAAAVGCSALVATSPVLFNTVKWAGVAYLAWLGLQQLVASGPRLQLPQQTGAARRPSGWQLFVRALLINSSNPKGYVFLLAVLPAFINPQRPLLPQYATATGTLMVTDFFVMCGYTQLGRSLALWMSSPRHLLWVQRLFGLLFMVAAAAIAGFSRV